MHKIQRRIYDHYMDAYGRPPPPVPLPADASWSPLVGNKDEYPPETGAPLANRAPKRSVGDAEEPVLLRAERERERDQDHDHDEDDDEDDRSRAGTSVAGTSRAGTSVHAFQPKEEFQPPPDEWAIDRERERERERQKRGVKREREFVDEEDYRMERDMRERQARLASPQSDVDDY